MVYLVVCAPVSETRSVRRAGAHRSDNPWHSAGAYRVSAGIQLGALAPRAVFSGPGSGPFWSLLRRGAAPRDPRRRGLFLLAGTCPDGPGVLTVSPAQRL